jgi:hypothetical protein
MELLDPKLAHLAKLCVALPQKRSRIKHGYFGEGLFKCLF